MISFRYSGGRERMQFSVQPRIDRDHLGGGVQLHGAGIAGYRLIQHGSLSASAYKRIISFFAVVTVKYRMRPESPRHAAYFASDGTAIKRHVFISVSMFQTVAVAQQNIEQLRATFSRVVVSSSIIPTARYEYRCAD